MKYFYPIIFMSVFVVSCSKVDKGDIIDPEQEMSLTACFTVNKDTINFTIHQLFQKCRNLFV